MWPAVWAGTSITSASTSPRQTMSPSADRPVERRDARRLGRRRGHRAAGRRLDRRIAAGVIGVPVGVPDLGDLPAAPAPPRPAPDRRRRDRSPPSRPNRARGPARHNCRRGPGCGRSRWPWPRRLRLSPEQRQRLAAQPFGQRLRAFRPAEPRRLPGPVRAEAERRQAPGWRAGKAAPPRGSGRARRSAGSAGRARGRRCRDW